MFEEPGVPIRRWSRRLAGQFDEGFQVVDADIRLARVQEDLPGETPTSALAKTLVFWWYIVAVKFDGGVKEI